MPPRVAVDEHGAAVAFDAPGVSGLDPARRSQVVPASLGGGRTQLELGQVHRQDDVHGPDDPGQAERRKGHQQRVEDLGRGAAFTQGAAEVLPKAPLGLRVDW
jgi:hypothetical protein